MSLTAKVEKVSISNLFLDPNNYRLINDNRYTHVDEEHIADDIVQKRTMEMLRGTKNENIRDLLDSFRINGYLPVDQIQVRHLGHDKFLVLEGNRRTAALKTIEQDNLDAGKFDRNILKELPVVIYEGADTEIDHLIVMGLKHISGNKKWGEWNQAQLIKKLSDSETLSEDDICSAVGIDKTSLRRDMRALALIEQYKESDYGDQFSEAMYSVFRELITYTSIKNWIGWNEDSYKAENSNEVDRLFALLSRDSKYEDSDSDQKQVIEPAITKREEARTLSKIVDDEKALRILEETRDITAAFNMSKAGVNEQLLIPQENLLEAFSNNAEALMQMQLQSKNYNKLQEEINQLQSFIDKKEDMQKSSSEDVFFDTIDTQFTELKIVEFKKFQNIKLTNLKRINIFAGNNNAGKTSVLESIYLLCKQNNFSGIQEIIRRRGKTSESKMSISWFIDQIPEKCFIDGVFDNMPASVSLSHIKEDNSDFDSTSYLETVKIESEYNGIKQNSQTRLFDTRDRDTRIDGAKIICPVIYSSPFFLNEPYRYSEFYYQSVKSKAIPQILEFIQESILPNVEDIRMADKLQRFLVSDKSFKSAMDISSYGEGLQRIFYISLLFASAQNGVLLIDEFENAIHVELLSKFTGFIEKLAEKFNVQVFLTSHSKECIDAFIDNVNNLDNISCCTLINDNNMVVAKQFKGKEFKRLLSSGNTDLRTIK